jgi:hypothetical protein
VTSQLSAALRAAPAGIYPDGAGTVLIISHPTLIRLVRTHVDLVDLGYGFAEVVEQGVGGGNGVGADPPNLGHDFWP